MALRKKKLIGCAIVLVLSSCVNSGTVTDPDHSAWSGRDNCRGVQFSRCVYQFLDTFLVDEKFVERWLASRWLAPEGNITLYAFSPYNATGGGLTYHPEHELLVLYNEGEINKKKCGGYECDREMTLHFYQSTISLSNFSQHYGRLHEDFNKDIGIRAILHGAPSSWKVIVHYRPGDENCILMRLYINGDGNDALVDSAQIYRYKRSICEMLMPNK